MKVYAPLTDNQWRALADRFRRPKPLARRKSRRRGGRPRLPDRVCFDALLWTVFHPRRELPPELCSARTLSRRVREWSEEGRLVGTWGAYVRTFPVQGQRELAAALSRYRYALTREAALLFWLEGRCLDQMRAAAPVPKTDVPIDPDLEALLDRFCAGSATKPSA